LVPSIAASHITPPFHVNFVIRELVKREISAHLITTLLVTFLMKSKYNEEYLHSIDIGNTQYSAILGLHSCKE
jgi:predicted transcriptional regulator